MNYKIRRAETKDIEEIIRLCAEHAEFEKTEFSTWDTDYYLYMDFLYLRPQVRNFGIGEQLVREIAKFANEKNFKQIQWHTPDFYKRIFKFYHRIGASSKQKKRFYLDV